MLFQLHNGLNLYVPAVFPAKETLSNWPSYRILFAIELVSITVAFPGVMLLIRALGNSVQMFHRNLISVVQVHFLLVTVSEATRFIIILYEINILQKEEDFDTLLFVIMTTRCILLCIVLMMVPAVIVERSFASCFIADYESIPRPWISSVVNAGSLILASLYYTIILLACLSTIYLIVVLAMSICMFIVSSLTLVVIYRRDSGKLRDITGETGKYAINYTLSLKFQLAENVRVAKILVYFSAGLSAWGSFGCCLSASSLVIFGEAHAVGQLVYSLLNNYIALSFTILVWCLLWSIGEIRRILTIFSTMSGCCHSSLRVTPITRSIAVTEHPHQTTEKYFDQLRSAWMHTSERRNP